MTPHSNLTRSINMEKKIRARKSRAVRFRTWLNGGICCFIAVISLALGASAQSTDRDNPTPLTSNDIRGNAIGKKVEYYYTLLAGPGEVILTVDSGAKGSFSQLEAELFDLDAQKLAQVQNLPYPGETSRRVTRVTFGAQQPVLLRIFLDRDAAQYLVRLGGAVQVAGPDASFSGAPAPATDPAVPAATELVAPQPAPNAPAPTPPVAPTETPVTPDAVAPTSNAAPAKITGLKKLWLKLTSSGEVLGLAGVGSIHIEMKDGTTQDIGLGKIKKMMVGAAAQSATDGSNITASGEDKSTSWQRLWLKLGMSGELNGRPLRLELKDGTVQEFSPAQVKKISLKK
jgi:hypothetical protein